MLNLPKLRKYAKELITNSNGVLTNAFLANRQNQIIMMAEGTKEEAIILSTLLTDSQYVIRLNIFGDDEPEEQQPLEIAVEFKDNFGFLYSLESNFIFGVLVDRKKVEVGHKMSNDAAKTLKNELQTVVKWINKDPV